jgi:DNA-binding transcriptional MocR family regulator
LRLSGVKAYIVTMTIWAPDLTARKGPRYRAIADALADDLARGRLTPGARLPTHRDLAETLGLTVGTVTRAYGEAARRGLLSGEVGRGTFVRGAVEREDDADGGAVDLSLNHPPPPVAGPEGPALARSLADLAVRRDLNTLLAYPPEGGARRHREAGAEWMRRSGLDVPAERVLVCGGSQHALTTVLTTVVSPGETVLTEALTYPGMKAIARLLRVRLHGLPLDGRGLRPETFEAACQKLRPRALYCVPTIQNPTGSVMPEERRKRIAAIARAYGVLLVEDDIHARLPPERPRPIAVFAPELTYYLTSTSKTLAPGLRIGYVLAPPGQAQELAAGIRATTWGAAPLMAEVASGWIEDGTAELLLEARRREAQARQELARRLLPGAAYTAHPYGYHLWLSLPRPWVAQAFAAEARRRGVLVTPAETFLVGEGPAPRAVRLGLGAARSRRALETGLRLVAETLAGTPGAEPVIV